MVEHYSSRNLPHWYDIPLAVLNKQFVYFIANSPRYSDQLAVSNLLVCIAIVLSNGMVFHDPYHHRSYINALYSVNPASLPPVFFLRGTHGFISFWSSLIASVPFAQAGGLEEMEFSNFDPGVQIIS